MSISISSPLIETCPWRVVVEVLKHELAHLITDLVYRRDDTPHGANFRRVCQLLRIEDWAQRASSGKDLAQLQQLSDWREAALDDRTSRYRSRLKKLLALAHSSNEHEGLLAMRRAQEMQEGHREEAIEQGDPANFVSLEVGAGKQRHDPFEGRIASILMTHFHVDIVFSSRFNATRCQPEAIIDILGRREDVLLAEYVRSFLQQSAASLWQVHRQESGARGLRSRNSYIRGLLAGFQSKLRSEQERREQEGASAALVACDEAQRQAFVSRRYQRLAARRSSARIDQSAYQRGKREGGKLSLKRPVEAGQAHKRGKLLH